MMVEILLPEHFSGSMPVIPPATAPRGISAEGSFCLGGGGGRIWWAHFEFTRINTAPTFLPKKIEELHIVGAFVAAVAAISHEVSKPTCGHSK